MEQGPGLGSQPVCLGPLGLTLSPGHRVTDQAKSLGTLTGRGWAPFRAWGRQGYDAGLWGGPGKSGPGLGPCSLGDTG